MTAILEHFKLKEKPFENVHDGSYFFPSPIHGEAISRLEYAIEERDMPFCVLSGEIGSGKTSIAKVLQSKLSTSDYRIISLTQCQYQFPYIISEIIDQLMGKKNPTPHEDSFASLKLLKDLIVARVLKRNQHLVLLLDDSQQLNPESMERLKSITHLDEKLEGHITIILIGQMGLNQKIQQMPQIAQRVSIHYSLGPLNDDEVKNYLVFRAQRAKHPTGRLFTDKAIEAISSGSNGIPRNINRLAKLSLLTAYHEQAPYVNYEVVKTVLDEIELPHFEDSYP
jgi:type II secretory pathway predicted ATPase ExeA